MGVLFFMQGAAPCKQLLCVIQTLCLHILALALQFVPIIIHRKCTKSLVKLQCMPAFFTQNRPTPQQMKRNTYAEDFVFQSRPLQYCTTTRKNSFRMQFAKFDTYSEAITKRFRLRPQADVTSGRLTCKVRYPHKNNYFLNFM